MTQLAQQTALVTGANRGMAPKSSPVDVVRQVLDGVEQGEVEVLADDLTRAVRAGLGQPIQARLAPFLP